MDFTYLQTFCEVAKRGNFTRFTSPSNLYIQVIYLGRKWRSQAFESLLALMGRSQ